VSLAQVAPDEKKHCSSGQIEKVLANLNANHVVSDNDVTIARFRFLLGEITKTFGGDPACLADQLFSTYDKVLLGKFGKNISLLEFTEDAYRGLGTVNTKNSAEYFAILAYAIGRQ